MLEKILSHVCFVLAIFMLTLLIIDQINSAMFFINNQGTKIIMMVYCVAAGALGAIKIAKR